MGYSFKNPENKQTNEKKKKKPYPKSPKTKGY